MSATHPNSSDGLEAIHRAQEAHEPSMEEILASIRNMIVDDPLKGAAPKTQQTPAPTPQIVHSRETVAPYGHASAPSERPDANAPAVVWRRPQAVEAEPAAGADPVQRSEERLLSPEAGEAASLSFGALTASLDVRSAELADELVRDMLRPMLKQWLDENLPPMVERLVRAEIQRVARGGR